MGKRILSIDDERMIHRVLEAHMHATDYELTTTESGAKGVELAGHGDFDLILCDLKLGDENGLDIIKAIKLVSKETPVIALSGLIDEEITMLAEKAGADDYLCKPFTKKALFSLIASYITGNE